MLQNRLFRGDEIVWVFSSEFGMLKKSRVIQVYSKHVLLMSADIFTPTWIDNVCSRQNGGMTKILENNPESLDMVSGDVCIPARAIAKTNPFLLRREDIIDLKLLSNEGKDLVSAWHPHVGVPLDTATNKQDRWNQFWKQIDIQKLLET